MPLAAVTEPELIASSIATAVGLLAPTRTPLERVVEHFADRTALIVLDNFEQVVAGAPVVAEILRGAPKLRMIVSSRAPLRIAGEQEFAVPPLPVPAAGTTDLLEIAGAEAVRLFVERAMAVRQGFTLTAENAVAVAEIVRRLDGLPLAIELAAARVRLLTPSAMVARLNDRLGLLSAGGRDLPERQRTLRGAIDWSHDLLDVDSRRLFARLSVFQGGGTFATAEAVCGADDAGTPDLDVLAGIEMLAEQSLIRILDDPHGDGRFVMLETIREYAAERLAEAGEPVVNAFRHRHARAYLELAAGGRGHPQLGGPRPHARPARGRPRQPPGRHRPRDRHRGLRAGVGLPAGPVPLLAHARPPRGGPRPRRRRPRHDGLDRCPVARPPAGARGRRRARLLGG